jgi:hypothetical protein
MGSVHHDNPGTAEERKKMYNIICPEPARTRLIQSELELHTLLLKYAAQDVELRMYPRSVVNFAERVLTDLYSGADLDELKYPPDESRPLLVQSLLDTSDQEMRPYDPKLIELAGRIYSHPSLYPALEQANREFIKLLNLGQWFEQDREFGQSTLVSRERFRREFGTDVRIPQVCTYGEIPQTP